MAARGTWITAALIRLKAPRTDANKKFLFGWWQCEGGNHGPKGNVYPSAKYNWLCTTKKAVGSTNFNPHGVQNYKTWVQGVNATVGTWKNGKYPDVIAALKSGNPFLNQPIDGLSIWLTGKPAANNPAGRAYAEKVIAVGWNWKL